MVYSKAPLPIFGELGPIPIVQNFFYWVLLGNGHGGIHKASIMEDRRKRKAKRLHSFKITVNAAVWRLSIGTTVHLTPVPFPKCCMESRETTCATFQAFGMARPDFEPWHTAYKGRVLRRCRGHGLIIAKHSTFPTEHVHEKNRTFVFSFLVC